jgi:hypothetical protein
MTDTTLTKKLNGLPAWSGASSTQLESITMQSKHSPFGPSYNGSLSRRGMIGAAGAVVASAAVSVPSALAGDHPDAELIELGRQLEPIIQRIENRRAKIEQIHEAGYDEKFEQLRAEYRQGNEQAFGCLNELQKELGLDVLLRPNDGDLDAMDPILRAILETPAATVAGLAVKARSASFVCSHWDQSDADIEWDQLHARSLIEAVLSLADQA